MFHPISASYQVSVEQMILLEPALVESITAPLVKGMKMAVDTCISKGVPEDVAMAFCYGAFESTVWGYFWICRIFLLRWRKPCAGLGHGCDIQTGLD